MVDTVNGHLNAALTYGEVGMYGVLTADTVTFNASVVVPVLTTAERDALTATNGMIVYNSTTNRFQGYEGGSWGNMREAVLG